MPHEHAEDTHENHRISLYKVMVGTDDHDYESASHKRLWLPLAQRVKRNIRLKVPHRRCQKPVYDDNFYVWYYSTPVEEETGYTNITDDMWGMTPTNRDGYACRLWMGAYPIITPEGNEIGALDSNNLYLYWDACHTQRDNEKAIIEKVVQYAIAVFDNPRAFGRRDVDNIAEENIARLVENVTSYHKNRLEKTESDIESYTHNIDNYRRQLVDALQKLDLKTIELQAVEEATVTSDERLRRAIIEIKKMPDVSTVRIIGSTVIVTTKNIVVREDVDVGCLEFKIEINDNCCVQVINKTRHVKHVNGYKYEAPWAVDQNRQPIWGALATAAATWCGKLEVDQIVMGLLRIIKTTPNEMSEHTDFLSRWPRVGGVKTEYESSPNSVPFKAIEGGVVETAVVETPVAVTELF